MKKFIFFLSFLLLTFSSSCCTDNNSGKYYWVHLKIDGNKNDKVSIKYIGPNKKRYREEFKLNSEYQIPLHGVLHAFTSPCSKDFKKHGYDFLEIKNENSEPITIILVPTGPEIDDFADAKFYEALLNFYHQQDNDPNFDYKPNNRFKDFEKYLNRNDFYKKLENEKYPYFVKLPPQKTCIVKWGNKGIQILN